MSKKWLLDLDAPLGASEQRTEPYNKYGEGVAQLGTKRSAKSAGRVLSSAERQGGTAHKPFAVFDIDGTLIRWQLFHAMADTLVKLGYANPKTYKPVKAARMEWKKRVDAKAFHNYEKQLIDMHYQVLTNLNLKQFEHAASAVFEEYKDQAYTYTRDLIKRLKSKGYLLFAISGSPAEIVKMIAKYYGFDDYAGSVHEWDDKGFSSKVIPNYKDKHLTLEKLVKKHGASYSGSIAVGDSHGDATLLQAVEKPIAFNPEKELFKAASSNGWPIVIERKNMIYKLEPRDGRYVLAETA